MKKRIQEYLENPQYNIMLERLLYMLHGRGENPDMDFDFEGDAELEELFGNFATSRVYTYSNEYLDSVFDGVDIDGGRALVVGSSGDQALHCIKRGAKEVTIMDANMWTIPFVELKLAAIKNLNFEDFNRYFSYGSMFSPRYYRKVSHDLSEQSQAFWDQIMQDFTFDDMIKAPDYFLHNAFEGQNFDYGKNFHAHYMDEEEYNKLRANLKNCKVNFEIAGIEEFADRAKGKYDMIMLSNIFDYVKNSVFFPVLRDLNDNHLTDGGQIQAYYTLGKKKNRSERQFVDGLNKFTEMCEGADIKVDIRDVSLAGTRVANWFKGHHPQKTVMLRKSEFGQGRGR